MPKTSVFYTKPAYGNMGKMQIKNGDDRTVGDGGPSNR